MPLPDFRIRLLDSADDRNAFERPSEPLNRYLQKQVSQDVKRKVATCFVAVTSDGQILGYYTLAATGVALSNIPAGFRKKLPRYPTVPAVLMGRLAVDGKYGGFGLGS
ncbi:GNAT family N-acetyltransferase, partial [Neisseria gonorrhoeae]